MKTRTCFLLALVVAGNLSCRCLADQREVLRLHSVVSAGCGQAVPVPLDNGKADVAPGKVAKKLEPADGFPEAVVRQFAQSADGSIWMATNFGLYSYDGFHVRHYDTGLLQDAICVCPIVRDGHEEIWLGSQQGLAILSITQKQIVVVDQFRESRIQCIAIDHLQRPLVGTVDGLFVGTQDGFSMAKFAGAESAIRSIETDQKKGTTWIGTNLGLCTLCGMELQPYSLSDADGLPVHEMHTDRNGALWLGTNRAVLRVTSENATMVYSNKIPQNNYVRDFTETEAGLTVSLANANIHIGRKQMIVDAPVPIESNRPYAANTWFVDRDGNRWCGSRKRYVVFERSDLQVFSTQRSRIVALQPDSDAVWFSTVSVARPPKLFRIQDGVFKSWEIRNNVRKVIWHNGRVLIGTVNGVFKLEGDEAVPHSDQLLKNKAVSDMVVGPDGVLWVATNEGVFKVDDDKVSQWMYDEDFRVVRRILPSKDGVTLATEQKIRHYDNQDKLLNELEISDGVFSRRIVDLLRTDNGRLWVGTTFGLFSQDAINEPLKLRHGKNQLLGSFLVATKDCRLWAGSARGPCLIDCETGVLQKLLPGDLYTRQRVYDCVVDGEFTWFAGNEGLYRYRNTSSPPELVVDRITSDRELDSNGPVQVTTDNKLLTVNFHAITPGTRTGSTLYRHRLLGNNQEGDNEEWSETRENTVELRDLAVGDYSLELQALDRNLTASKTVTVPVSVSLPKFRYATYVVTSVSLLLFACMAGYIFYYQRRQNKIMAEEVSKAVGEQLRLEEGLRQAQKLESLGTLAAGMAHDFNNALHVVSMCSEIAMQVDDRDDLIENITMIQDAAKQGQNLTRAMLTLAGNQPSQAETVDLAELTADCLEMVGKTLPKSIEVQLDIDSDQRILVEVDPAEFKQVLINLFLNARDAMVNGGILSVSVQPITKNGSSMAQVEVRDSGAGISHENLERIFEPFYTTKPRGKGTGLGLAMARGIIRGHNGTISVESFEGRGSCFNLCLPRTTAEHELSARPQKTTVVPTRVPSSKLMVLVAEDHEPAIKVMVKVLKDCGCDVLTADNGAKALELACVAYPDVLVLDIDMPILDGLTVLEKLRSSGHETPAVVVTGAPVQAKVPPNTIVLLKPFTNQQLREAVIETVHAPVASPTTV